MNIERKFTPLKSLKVSDEGSGSIEGYRSVFGEIDEGGDIVVKGAFAASHDEYMQSGFTAHSHDWDFDKAVGFPIDAKEDEYGWYVTSKFHSTSDAQDVRTKAKERMEAGKTVGFSFGYRTDDFSVIEQKDFKDQLPLFIKAERLEENLKKAQKFSRIRILKRVSAIEDSLVTSPMNKLAAATAVKSDEPLIEPIEDVDLPAGKTFEEHSQSVLAAVSELAERAKEIAELRKKEGRQISTARRARLSGLLTNLKTVTADIEALLAETEPPPKGKDSDVAALRLQAMQLSGKALAALSR